MDDYDIRLRCLELCGGDFDAAQRAIAFVKGIGVPEITADTWRETYWRCADCGTQWPVDVRCTCIGSSRRDKAAKAAKAAVDPEQSTEAFLAALKSGGENDELTRTAAGPYPDPAVSFKAERERRGAITQCDDFVRRASSHSNQSWAALSTSERHVARMNSLKGIDPPWTPDDLAEMEAVHVARRMRDDGAVNLPAGRAEQWTPEEVKAIRANRDAALAQYGVVLTGDMVGHEGGSVADELGWNIA